MRLLVVLLSFLVLAALPAGENARAWQPPAGMQSRPAGPSNWLQELAPGLDYAAWYQVQTGYAPDETYFGAYAFHAISDTLYIGFGAARPAESNGSLLASSDGVTVTAAYQPTEQGFIDMASTANTLLIPGPDPTDAALPGGHPWDWGNFYTFTPPAAVVKHRNLPDVIHAWGTWYDAGRSTLYVAAGAHLGDYATWTGQVYTSTDMANNWTLVAGREDGIGQYRTYDIIGFDDKLYAVWNDVYPTPCGLAESGDDGRTWTRLSTAGIVCRARLVVFANRLLALSEEQAALLAVDWVGAITTHPFPDFRVTSWSYNPFTIDGNGHLVTVTEDGRVVRSADLASWETLASTDRVLFSTGYWPDKDWLVVAERGSEDANIWKIDLDQAGPIVLAQAPALTAARSEDAVYLNWPDVIQDEASQPITISSYRIYRSNDPYFAPTGAARIATTSASELTDNDINGADVIGDPNHNYFYVVRAVDAAGSLSVASNRAGKFDFALVPGGP